MRRKRNEAQQQRKIVRSGQQSKYDESRTPECHLINVGPTGQIASVHRFAAVSLLAGPPTSLECISLAQ